MGKVKSIFAHVAAAVLGLLAGFIVDFNVVFSDIFGWRQHAGALVYVVIAYAIISAPFGMGSPEKRRRWFWIIAGPGMALLTLFSLLEVSGIPWHALVIAATVGSTWGTLTLCARLRKR